MTYSLTPHPITAAEQSMEEVIERKDTQQMLDDMALERARTGDSITSKLSASHFAVLPHGTSLLDWSREDKQALNDHVRHMLHSRRSKFKRGMKGFGQYVRRRKFCPLQSGRCLEAHYHAALGFLVTLYATLITLFGLAWVLFLIGKLIPILAWMLLTNISQVGFKLERGKTISSMSLTISWWPYSRLLAMV